MVDPKSKDPNHPFLPNFLDYYYPNRSPELENFSLYNIAVNYKVGKERPGEPILKPTATRVNTDVLSPHYRHIVPRHSIARTRSLLHLVKPRLARFFIPQYDESDACQCEDFYRRMCLLFIPWRKESEILLAHEQSTYFETFLSFMNELKNTSRNAYNEIVGKVEIYQDFKKDVQRAKLKADQIQAALSTLDVEQDRDELQVQARIVNENDHDIAVGSLNDEQKVIFDMNMEGVDNSLNGTKSLLLFCSGTAGVGKSYVIDRIADAIHLTYGSPQNQLSTPSVLLAAPTGLAAIAICGLTLHSLLGLKVAKDGETTYEILSDENRDIRRVLFENVKLLIVDEASMVSSIMLATISNRLREITGKTTPFGGMNVVFFGDFLQLPPVKAQPIYEELSGYIIRKYFGGMGTGISLWKLFTFFELTKNVRQSLDTEYAGILEVMENAARYRLEQSKKDPYIMTVVPRITEVDQFNDLVIGLMGTKGISLIATENVTTSSVSTKARPWQRKVCQFSEYSILPSNLPIIGSTSDNFGMQSTAGGLREELKFTLNCRVILRRTIDRVKGLVNGLTGVLEDINVVSGQVQKLGVRFDRLPDEIIWVTRVTVMYTDNRRRMKSRTQFPSESAAAVTIHKAQGLTLDNVIMKTSSIFANSQMYVGASRVKTMAGLHLIDFDATKVQIDQGALTEYERLRSSTLP
ncbi:hypothetical protein CRE_06741 [Caenorhabditis remanei]|uniref:ATP-dependent DNA helicase n=1 Tax=Caenorhabditis remanei TaxID=31234 RepID=E3MNX1_CAERE|nr:hypothetical protein CRE_06741 [Caenorhabditis remanei]